MNVDPDATLVHISVREILPGSSMYDLGVFPSRAGEVKTFYDSGTDPKKRHKERPRKVTWVTHGIPAGWVLAIRGKSSAKPLGVIAMVTGDAAKPEQTTTGTVQVKKKDTWSYNVFLYSPGVNPDDDALAHASVDPDIDIHPDP
ncbi:MAG TPA: hypothetical protein VN896_04605 [Methylomirabilota bacterium]|jgi:hypothetical protein|nr:hypothetical protein [Methylomirabilota bacterium]